MKKIGLALSGGGFRASLYHLGLVRFLRDAGILSQVSHITSVSGGSIFSAHLALNWDRYNGSAEEFAEAAAEFLAFVRLDVRSRILRRFPLTVPLRWLRRLLGKSNRKLTRTGLLEYHYEKYLYGDVSLFELPVTPQLHLLTTNLSEGCLCSFNREGLLMVRREQGHAFRIDRIHTGLATVPMAVTASSAFPGFFPPLDLTGVEVGVSDGAFGRQSYTDGGVYDNLGVRMFRFLDRQILADDDLSRDDFLDLPAAFEALRAASVATEASPLRRLAQVLDEAGRSTEDTPLQRLALALEQAMSQPGLFQSDLGTDARAAASSSADTGMVNSVERILSRLWDVIRHYQFQHEPLFADLKPVDPAAAELLQASRIGSQRLDLSGQVWLNRHLIEAAFRQATGQACFRRLNSGLDCVIVSDVGKQIKVTNAHGGGLIRTALRASDILMDRVWQLENETFMGAGGFVFAPITAVVEPGEDPTAPHHELQRQAANIRTDLDAFTPLEISSLVRHGYCIGRKACRSRPDLFGGELPDHPPWDPIPQQPAATPPLAGSQCEPAALPEPTPTAADARDPQASATGRVRSPWFGRRVWTTYIYRKGSHGLASSSREPTATTAEARELQLSSTRRILGSLFDRRDWTTYIYVPILVPILLFLPYFSIHYYQRSVRLNNLSQSFAQGSPDLAQLSRMLDDGPPAPWTGVAVEVGHDTAALDPGGFKILNDSRITDLRAWNPVTVGKAHPGSRIYAYRRLKVVKLPDNKGRSLFHVRLILTAAEGQVCFPPQELQGKARKTALEGGQKYRWEAIFDFERVPDGRPVEIVIEIQSPGLFLQGGESTTGMVLDIEAPTAELSQWVLMPKGRDYKNYRYIYYKKDEPDSAKDGLFATEYLSQDSTILAFRILSLEPGYEHEIFWNYKE